MTMHLPIQAVIFDCDGTLVDSEPLGFIALLEEGALHGMDPGAAEALAQHKGASMATQIAVMQQHVPQPLPADFETTLRARMARLFRERLLPMPGAYEVVANLGLPCCVATNGPRHKTELTLGLCGLLPLFEGALFSAYDIGRFKPAPDLYLHAAGAMGVPPAQCAVVEDSLPGMQAGLAAGMTVFALGPPDMVLPPNGGSRIERIASLSELPARLAAAR